MEFESKGLKRKLLNNDERLRSSTKHMVLSEPAKERSPKCLVTTEPCTDSEDNQSSPECLLPSQPIIDPYSSDDIFDQEKNYRLPSSKTEMRKQIFKKNNCCLDFCPAEVLFFWDPDFLNPGEEVDLSRSTTVEIMEQIFSFIFNEEMDNKGIIGSIITSDRKTLWKNQTMTELYDNMLLKYDILKWLFENDTIDIKTLTCEEYQKVIDAVADHKKLIGFPALHYKIQSWFSMINKLRTQHSRGYDNHDVMGTVFMNIEKIGELPVMRTDGESIYCLPYYVPEELATNNSNIYEDRHVTVSTKPDGCYTVYTDKHHIKDTMGKIVLEVYAPMDKTRKGECHSPEPCDDSGSSSECDIAEDGNVNPVVSPQNQPISHSSNMSQDSIPKKSQEYGHFNKPKRTQNAIHDSQYHEQARNYICSKLPALLRDNGAATKAAGQHILQLISLASEINDNINHNKSENFSNGDGKVLGLFMHNENIFLSRLFITNQKLQEFFLGSRLRTLEHVVRLKIPPAKIRFSNFKIDISRPNHRLALIMFLKEYLNN